MQDVWAQWRGELIAVLVVGGILALWAVAGFYHRAGPAKAELGEVVRFGSYANDLGNQPTVIVRTSNGRQHELKASRASLLHCRVGDRLRLVRQSYSLRVHPIGCR